MNFLWRTSIGWGRRELLEEVGIQGKANIIREIEFQITECYLTETIILIMYCCVVNYPKPQWLKTTNTISECLWLINSGTAQLGGSGSGSHIRLQTKCQPELLSSEVLIGASQSASKLIHMAVGRRLHFLTSYWLKAVVPCHMGRSVAFFSVLMTWHLASCRLSGPREGAKRKLQQLYVLISDMTHYQFHHILFFKSTSLGQPTFGGGESDSTFRMEKYQRICGHMLQL